MTDIISPIIAGVLLIVGALFIHRRGRKAEQADRAKRHAKADARATARAKEARNEVDRMSDADVDRELRERARKP